MKAPQTWQGGSTRAYKHGLMLVAVLERQAPAAGPRWPAPAGRPLRDWLINLGLTAASRLVCLAPNRQSRDQLAAGLNLNHYIIVICTASREHAYAAWLHAAKPPPPPAPSLASLYQLKCSPNLKKAQAGHLQ